MSTLLYNHIDLDIFMKVPCLGSGLRKRAYIFVSHFFPGNSGKQIKHIELYEMTFKTCSILENVSFVFLKIIYLDSLL